jgi:hypothetical protein
MAQTENERQFGAASLERRPIVEVHHAGRKIGLYRVQGIGWRAMVLGHGGISFPVGTELVIDDFQRLAIDSRKRLPARVVRNDVQGIAVTW